MSQAAGGLGGLGVGAALRKEAKKEEDSTFDYVRKAGPGIGALAGAGIGAVKGGPAGAVKGALTGAGVGWMPDVLATAAEETAEKVGAKKSTWDKYKIPATPLAVYGGYHGVKALASARRASNMSKLRQQAFQAAKDNEQLINDIAARLRKIKGREMVVRKAS